MAWLEYQSKVVRRGAVAQWQSVTVYCEDGSSTLSRSIARVEPVVV